MKAPIWKRILSYVHEFHMETVYSDHNPDLHVSFARGQYQLYTENAIYSYGSLYDNFRSAFAQVELDRLPIQKVLVLGLGLASIPYILEKNFRKKYHYTGVEIDEAVVYLANKYVIDEIESSLEIYCTDAELFVEQCQEKFDLICVDLFLDVLIPSQFEQIEFLKELQRLLSDKGILLYNRLATTKEDIKENQLFYDVIFKEQFPQAAFLPIDENWVLVNRADCLKK